MVTSMASKNLYPPSETTWGIILTTTSWKIATQKYQPWLWWMYEECHWGSKTGKLPFRYGWGSWINSLQYSNLPLSLECNLFTFSTSNHPPWRMQIELVKRKRTASVINDKKNPFHASRWGSCHHRESKQSSWGT